MHRSVFYHTQAIEAQMKIDRKAILDNREYIKLLCRQEHTLRFKLQSLWWFSVIGIALVALLETLR